MSAHRKTFSPIWIPLIAGILLAGCVSPMQSDEEGTVLDAAEAEATQIIQQAQATALVLQAQTEATVMMAQAGGSGVSGDPGPTLAVLAPTSVPKKIGTAQATPAAATKMNRDKETTPQEIRILRVGFAGEGGMILIQFIAPPDEAEKWWQGSVSVLDEDTGELYNEIPVMPKIGPMIGRPKRYGQIGYVMLVNAPPYLQPGAKVTVTLGAHIFEHIKTQ